MRRSRTSSLRRATRASIHTAPLSQSKPLTDVQMLHLTTVAFLGFGAHPNLVNIPLHLRPGYKGVISYEETRQRRADLGLEEEPATSCSAAMKEGKLYVDDIASLTNFATLECEPAARAGHRLCQTGILAATKKVRPGVPLTSFPKAQGTCGSCWAHATVSALESALATHALLYTGSGKALLQALLEVAQEHLSTLRARKERPAPSPSAPPPPRRSRPGRTAPPS